MTEPEILPPKYATFNTRMLATSIELGLLMIIFIPIVDWVMEAMFSPVNPDDIMPVITNWQQEHDPDQLLSHLWIYVRDNSLIQRMVVENVLQVLLIAAYVLPFWFRYSTTPGKMIFRARIVDAKTGDRMTHRQCIIRFLGYIVSGIPFTLGFLWIALNRKRRGFHDMIADTVVVIQPKKPKPEKEQSHV